MKNSKNKGSGKLIGALLLGATVGGAVGAALGMLYAPEKGNKARKQLVETGDNLVGSAKELVK